MVTDTDDVMSDAYHPAGLTAVLVDRDGSVRSVRRHLGPAVQLKDSMRALPGRARRVSTTPASHAAGRSGRAAGRLTRGGAAVS